MSIDEGLIEWVKECLGEMSPGHLSDARGASRPKHLEPLGAVTMRKMMGGGTLYLDGAIFAIIVDGELWFKSDDEANAFWDGEGCTERFAVTFRDGTVDRMNYRRAPTDVYDDAEAMQRYAAVAAEAGRRRPVKKRKAKKP